MIVTDLANCKWDTEYDEANKMLTHTFSDRVKVITNLKECMTIVYKDGNRIRTIDADISIKSYTNFLLSVADDAEKLKQFDNEK